MGGWMRNKLTATEIKNTKSGRLFDGGGLYLKKTDGSGRWLYRFQLDGKRREMGLGSLDQVSLKEARAKRDAAAKIVADGRDPIDAQRLAAEIEREARNKTDPTFAEATDITFEAKRSSLRGGGEQGRWRSPIDTHMIPVLGRKRMTQIPQAEVQKALAPIWNAKPDTARKAMNRTRQIFHHCRMIGIDCHEETVERAAYALGKRTNTSEPIPATPWRKVPEVYAELEGRGVSGKCLQLIILTHLRGTPVRGARKDELDEPTGIWTVPAERMKGQVGKVEDFRVPLSIEAQRIWTEMAEMTGDFLFPGTGKKKAISVNALLHTLNTIGEAGRPHGFRSSFRDWVAETRAGSFEAAETALSHRFASKVQRSYERTDYLDERRALSEKWARFVTGETASVVGLDGRALG